MQPITGKTKLLGIIGNPVKHSLSPIMQNAAIKHLAVDYIYIPFSVKSENLATALTVFLSIGVQGFNITIPHKQSILPLLSDITQTAKLVGAVNTVWRTETGWQGTNTDVIGFLAPLKSFSKNWQTISPIILGNGGAARAVVVSLAELGCPQIHVVGRDQNKLDKFKQSWLNHEFKVEIIVQTWDKLSDILSETELLINTTPIGMSLYRDRSPMDSSLWKKITNQAIIYDLIYTPSPTQFLKEAKEQGLITIDGSAMLVYQGATALELWLQQSVPVDVMSRSLKEYLLIVK